jgi:hypothetical protein
VVATPTVPVGTDGPDGRVLIRVGSQSFLYWLSELPTQIPGRAFRMTLFAFADGEGPRDYTVLIGADPADTSCECKGWSYFGHCKHATGLRDLLDRGDL